MKGRKIEEVGGKPEGYKKYTQSINDEKGYLKS
jgi:hypothetical protein